MKQIKTAYEILKESGVYPEDFISFSTMGGCENAMRAYAEQFIEAAAEECGKRIIPGHNVQAPTMINAGEAILKLKEHLK